MFPALFFYVSKILRQYFSFYLSKIFREYFYLSKMFSQYFDFYLSKNWAITFYFYLKCPCQKMRLCIFEFYDKNKYRSYRTE